MLERIKAEVARAQRFLDHDLWSWSTYVRTRSRSGRFFILAARAAWIVAVGFFREGLKLRAAALTYVTLLSLVPAVAVVLSIFGAFGGLADAEQRLRRLILENLVVGRQDQWMSTLDGLLGAIDVGAVGGLGTAVLVLTALSLLSNVEKAFNDIWGIKEDRSLLRRFLTYWPLLTLGPVFLGASLTATASLEASRTVRGLVEVVPGLGAALSLGPILLTWLGFSLAYVIMPNTRVSRRCALIGGFVAGVLWEVGKGLYASYAQRAITYSALYGSLSVIPLSIVWVYVSWLIALIGALLTFAVQNVRTYEPHQDAARVSAASLDRYALALVLVTFGRFARGAGPTTAERLLQEVGAPPRTLQRVLARLSDGGLLLRTTAGADPAYSPARPAESTSVDDVLEVTRRGTGPESSDGSALLERIRELLDDAEAPSRTALRAMTIAELLTRLGAEPAPPAPAVVASPARDRLAE